MKIVLPPLLFLLGKRRHRCKHITAIAAVSQWRYATKDKEEKGTTYGFILILAANNKKAGP